MSDEEFLGPIEEGVKSHARHETNGDWSQFVERIHYVSIDSYEDERALGDLGKRLEEIESELGLPGNRLFYLATPPSGFGPIVRALGGAGLVPPGNAPFSRVVVEKPFGTDLASAQRLNKELLEVLQEEQIYRIDHYLGKETVQNLMVFRFGNGMFEPTWNNRYIDHVEITGAEEIGVGGRAGYFDEAGILRDMVQNHLFQVLAMTAMEPPVSFDADAVRTEKTKVLQAIRPMNEEQVKDRVVRGQYAAGEVGGEAAPGYLDEDGVKSGSHTETFVALELYVDNWRWAGVPFYLRSGKHMPKKSTEVSIVFKSAPHRLFATRDCSGPSPSVLTIRIQPDEGIDLSVGAKVPGPDMEIAQVKMSFEYASLGIPAPEAYERLLLDVMEGDSTLFTRADEVEASWKVITPIHEAWAADDTPPEPYPAGTWGPECADRLLARSGRKWKRS